MTISDEATASAKDFSTIASLIEGHPHPITTGKNDSLQAALIKMVEHNYSQLPVIDEENVPIGIITSDSVVRALNTLQATTKELRVYDAMLKLSTTYRTDDNIFDALSALHDEPALIVVDGERKVKAIITSYDVIGHFRQRLEDTLAVQAIEETIKKFVEYSLTNADGKINPEAQQQIVTKITPSNPSINPFQKALREYIGKSHNSAPFNEELINHLISKYFPNNKPKTFGELTFNDYITILLLEERWKLYQPILHLSRTRLDGMLSSVRKTRNDLAHLRTNLTAQQRYELRYCKDWLAGLEEQVRNAFFVEGEATSGGYTEPSPPFTDDGRLPSAPHEEAETANDSRYTRLALYLQDLPSSLRTIRLTFGDIERVISDRLPPSARQLRAWWANDSQGHVQSQEWLGAGWRVSSVSLSDERITFSRIEGREQAYIDFFSTLIADLKQEGHPKMNPASPDGTNWLFFARAEPGASLAYLNFAFAFRKRFRVELYIDSGQKERNKRLFDALRLHQNAIEGAVGESLSWERLDDRRASRIAIYHPGAIADSPASHAALRAWAVPLMLRFQKVMDAYVPRALTDLEGEV